MQQVAVQQVAVQQVAAQQVAVQQVAVQPVAVQPVAVQQVAVLEPGRAAGPRPEQAAESPQARPHSERRSDFRPRSLVGRMGNS